MGPKPLPNLAEFALKPGTSSTLKRSLKTTESITKKVKLSTALASVTTVSEETVVKDNTVPTDEQLLQLENQTLDPSWLKVGLAKEIQLPYFLNLKKFLWKEGFRGVDDVQHRIVPPAPDVYTWSRLTPIDKVRVVIL